MIITEEEIMELLSIYNIAPHSNNEGGEGRIHSFNLVMLPLRASIFCHEEMLDWYERIS